MASGSGCLLCHGAALEPVVSLTPTPPANDVAGTAEEARGLTTYPLDLVRCAGCGHVQLVDVIAREELFADYRYATGAAPALVAHCEELAAETIERLGLPPGASVLEIGSNDGTQLRAFASRGMRVLGVDPAVQLGRDATAGGIPTITAHFGPEAAEKIAADHGRFDLVVASNVVAHVSDVNGVLSGIRELLAPDGVAVIEVAHVLPMAQGGVFELIYHEHLSYFSLHAFEFAARANGLGVFRVDRTAAQAGSLRCWIGRAEQAARRPAEGVEDVRRLEAEAGVPDGSFLADFASRIDRVCTTLRDVVHGLAANGKRLAGYGASARAVTLLAQAGVGGDIRWIADDNPRKVGLFTPGDGIAIVDPRALTAGDIDYCVLFAWNFEKDIRSRNTRFIDGGGAFVVPFPELVIR